MNLIPEEVILQYYLYPGNIFVHRKPHKVTTILGSCVAVCLWDCKLRIGGINHFVLPLWNGIGLATPKYGNIAIHKLLEKIFKLGSEKKDLVAKIFGGAAVLSSSNNQFNIGERNIIIARDILQAEKIPIANQSVGGIHGRKINFFTHTGMIFGKMLSRSDLNL